MMDDLVDDDELGGEETEGEIFFSRYCGRGDR